MNAIATSVINFIEIFYATKFNTFVDYLRPFFLMPHDENNPHFRFPDAEKTVDRIITDEYVNYLPSRTEYMVERSDSISVTDMLSMAKIVLKAFWQIGFFERLSTTNKDFHERNGVIFGTSKHQDSNIFAMGHLAADYRDNDPDPYMTAGGYRNWIALKDTPVFYHLDEENRVYVTFDSNCEVDHYNNNFFGNSIGGGTTKYKMGERVEKRTFKFDYHEFMDTSKRTDYPFIAKVDFVDPEKGLRIAKKNLGIE